MRDTNLNKVDPERDAGRAGSEYDLGLIFVLFYFRLHAASLFRQARASYKVGPNTHDFFAIIKLGLNKLRVLSNFFCGYD